MVHTDVKQAVENFEKDSIVESLMDLFFYENKRKPILSAYGKSWDENTHSSFLAWLLDKPNGDTRLGYFFQHKLIQLLVKRGMDESLLEKEEVIKLLAFSPEDTPCYTHVHTEYRISSQNRIDLYVEYGLQASGSSANPNKLRIILENKIDAEEHQDQTMRYYLNFEEQSKEEDINVYVYLSPKLYVKGQDAPCKCKSYIQLSYQDILDHLLLPSMDYDVDPSVKLLIEDYINVLNTPSQTKKYPVLAMTQENKELLQDFWATHQELILSALEVMASKEDILDEEEHRKVKDMLTSLQKRDYSKFQINLDANNAYTKTNLPYQVVKVAKEYGLTAQELEELNFSLKQEKVTFLKTEANWVSGGVERAKPIIIDDTRFYISNQWTADSIEKFVNAINATKSGAFADVTISKVD